MFDFLRNTPKPESCGRFLVKADFDKLENNDDYKGKVDIYESVDWDKLPPYIKYRIDKFKNKNTGSFSKPLEEFKDYLEIDIDYEVEKYNEMIESVVKCLKKCITLGKYTGQPDKIYESAKEIMNKIDFSILDSDYGEPEGLYRRNSYEVELVAKELGYVVNKYFKN